MYVQQHYDYNINQQYNVNLAAQNVEANNQKVKLTIKAVDETGKVIGSTQTASGDAGVKLKGMTVPTVTGYKLTEIKVNDKKVDMDSFKLPTELPSKSENIEYVFKAIDHTATVQVKDGSKIIASKVTTGGPSTKIEIPTIPTGNKIENITVDGVVAKDGKIPAEIGTKDTNIVINVSKAIQETYTTTVKCLDGSGNVIGNSNGTNVAGTVIVYPNISSAYKIKKITVNGEVVSTLPKTTSNKNENIVIEYSNPATVKLTIKGVDTKGNPLFSASATGQGGSSLDKLHSIPNESNYTLTKILVNGKAVNKDTYKLPTTMPDSDTTIEYVYGQKEYTATVKIEGEGITTINKETSGTPGTKIDMPSIPAGTHVVEVLVNGVKQAKNEYPTLITNKNTEIVVKVAKDQASHSLKITENYSDGSTKGGSGTLLEGATITYPKTTAGFKIDKIVVNGKTVDKLPTKMSNSDMDIVITLSKIDGGSTTKPDTNVKPSAKAKITVSAVDESGKVVGSVQTASGDVGAKLAGLKVPTVDGYKLVGITVNGNKEDVATFKLPTEVPTNSETINYIFKAIEHTATVQVKDGSKVIASKVTTGKPGTKIEIPTIPTGNKIENITVDGVVSKDGNMPAEIGTKDTNVVINVSSVKDKPVAKTYTTTVKCLDSKGQEIGSASITNVAGTKINYPTIHHEIKSITVDGKVVSKLPTVTSDKNENIVITYNMKEQGAAIKLEIEGLDLNNNILFTQSIEGQPGAEANGLQAIPKEEGYTLTKILVNGKEVNKDGFKIPTTIPEGNTVIKYIYTQNQFTTTVNIKEQGKADIIKTTKGVTGTKVEMPTIPNGTHIVEVLINGVKQPKNEYPTMVGTKDTNVTIVVAKNIVNHTVKITEKYPDGAVKTLEVSKGEGSKIEYPSVEKGYKIKSITVDGVVVQQLPQTIPNKDSNIVVTFEKINGDKDSNTINNTNADKGNTSSSNDKGNSSSSNDKGNTSSSATNNNANSNENANTDKGNTSSNTNNSGNNVVSGNTSSNTTNNATDANTGATGSNSNQANSNSNANNVDTNNNATNNNSTSNMSGNSSAEGVQGATTNTSSNANNNSDSHVITKLPDTGVSSVSGTEGLGVLGGLLAALSSLALFIVRRKK